MQAHLDGLTITWTPNNGPIVTAPTTYPGAPQTLPSVLVHPIAPGQDSHITHYPGQGTEDVTWQDIIISFPSDSGVPPLFIKGLAKLMAAEIRRQSRIWMRRTCVWQ